MSFSCLALKPGDHLVKKRPSGGEEVWKILIKYFSNFQHAVFCGQFALSLAEDGGDDVLQHVEQMEPFVVFLKQINSGTMAVWKESLQVIYNF